MTGSGFSKDFEAAMDRVRQVRSTTAVSFSSAPLPDPVPKKVFRRSGLMAHGMPDTNFSVFNFIGWVHTRGALREKQASR